MISQNVKSNPINTSNAMRFTLTPRGTSLLAPLLTLLAMGSFTSCSSEDDPVQAYNPSAYIKDEAKLTMLHSLVDKEGGKGRIYEMNYTSDYKLDDALDAQISGLEDLQRFAVTSLFDRTSSANKQKISFGAGCSAYAATDSRQGHCLMGRNYDFCHKNPQDSKKEDEIAAILVRTAPEGGKKSVSMVDGYWLGYKRGFYEDRQTDLSMLMLAPYALMDGINEDGFAIGVLHLDGLPAVQREAGKPTIYLSVAMRMLLDKASTVKEATEMLKNYNMNMESSAKGSYHFFMADATGHYAIVEYVNRGGDINVNPDSLDVLADTLRYTTNFYNSPRMESTPYGNTSDHGKHRYNILKTNVDACKARMTPTEAMILLQAVSQEPNTDDPTSHTQWSSLYDLTTKTLRLSILREYDEEKLMDFRVQ